MTNAVPPTSPLGRPYAPPVRRSDGRVHAGRADPVTRPPFSRPLYGAAGLGALFLVLEAVPRLGLVNERYLPPASEILRTPAAELATPELWTALGQSMW